MDQEFNRQITDHHFHLSSPPKKIKQASRTDMTPPMKTKLFTTVYSISLYPPVLRPPFGGRVPLPHLTKA
jgi:hypothetical protein